MNDNRYPAPLRTLDLLVQGAFVSLTLLAGMLLTPPRARWVEGALILAVGVIVAGAMVVFVNRFYVDFIKRMVAEHLSHVTTSALLRDSNAGELVTKELLSALERTMELDTIWIVCRDFGDDLNAPFLDVIRHNVLERGVSYVYITQKGANSKYQFDQLRRALGIDESDERLRHIPLTRDQRSALPYTAGNVTIYDPVASAHRHGYRSPRGVFWYPGGDGESFGWLGEDVVRLWAAEISEICFSAQNGHGTPQAIAKPLPTEPHAGEDPAVEGSDA